MSQLKYICIVFVLLAGVHQSIAQTVFQPKPIEYNLKGVIYSEERVFEARIHAQGFAFGFRKGKLQNYYKTTYYGIEFGYTKDASERRRNKNLSVSGERLSSAFIYGKQNELFNVRFSLGEKRYLSEKTRRRGIAVGFIYEGGASLGLLKPYYLKVIRTESDRITRNLETIRFTDELKEDFINDDIIYGGAGFFKGFSQISPRVGLHGKAGMHLAIGAFDKQVKAAEVGLMLDVYPSKVPILVARDGVSNNFFFAKLYLSFQFGSRKL